MSTDSSRHAPFHSGEPSKKNGDSSTLKPSSKRGGAVQIAYRPAVDPDDSRCAAATTQPGSGRPTVAQLPTVEKETYRIEGDVAQGGIGRVLSARDVRLDRRVAVKVLLEESGAYEERFVREALVTARLQHPSIVPVYEAGRWPSGEPFYAMKLVSGQPLLEIIEKSRTLDERLPLLTRVLAVADAVAYAHERRIIHRDLKPANILIGAHGETVLIDWGLAKDLNEGNASPEPDMPIDPNAGEQHNALTMMGSVMGTPSYMPPEQAAGDAVDERADVYALGSILYHVLSGKQPYEGYNGMQTIMRVLEQPPPALTALQSGIPRDLLTIIEKAMHRDRAARYPTAKEFAEDLRRFLTGQLVGAHHYSSRERALRFVRKHRTAFSVAAVALVVMLISAAVFVSRIVEARDRAEAERNRAEAAREKALFAEQHAIERADDLTLVEARAAVDRDPNAALAWLKALSPSFHKWNAARVIAADAWSRGVSTMFSKHKEVINMMALSPDEKLLVTASDDRTARIFDMATGSFVALEGHTDEVWSTDFSHDGKRVVTGGKDRTIRIWDVATGKTTVTLEGHEEPVVYTAFSRDDKLLFSQSDDTTLRVWDLATGTNRILAFGRNRSAKAAASPDGEHFVTVGKDDSVWLVGLDGAEPKRLEALSVHSEGLKLGGIYPIRFSNDGRYIAAGGRDNIIRIWDIQAEKLRVLEGQTSPIARVAFSFDDKLLAAASLDGSLRLWDLEVGTSRALASQDASVRTLAFSPDGRLLAAGGNDRSIRVIELATGRRRRFVGMQDGVIQSLFTKDSSRLLAASGDGSVRMFRLEQDAGRLLGRHPAAVYGVDVAKNGDRIVTSGKDGVVRIWSTRADEPAIPLDGHVGAVLFPRFSPNGELVVTSGIDGTVRLWDSLGHQVRAVSVEGNGVPKTAFSPDGTTIAIGDGKGAVWLWNTDSGAMREIGHHAGNIMYVAFAPDGRKLGTASVDKTARVWNIESGTSTELRGHEHVVTWITFSPDSSIVTTGSYDHRLRFWDPGATEPRVYDASGYTVIGLSFLPDGKSLVSIGGVSSARLWEVETGKTLQLFRGHRGNVTSIQLSQDGSVFVTGGDDNTVRLYDIEAGESRVAGVHEGVVHGVGIDPEGKWVVSVGEDGAVRLWSDDLPREPEALREWIAKSVSEEIDVNNLGEGSTPLP